MEEAIEAIARSNTRSYRRTYVLLVLNLLGVVCCVAVTLFLCLWAIFEFIPEPLTSPVVLEFIKQKKEQRDTRIAREMSYRQEADIFVI